MITEGVKLGGILVMSAVTLAGSIFSGIGNSLLAIVGDVEPVNITNLFLAAITALASAVIYLHTTAVRNAKEEKKAADKRVEVMHKEQIASAIVSTESRDSLTEALKDLKAAQDDNTEAITTHHNIAKHVWRKQGFIE